MPTKNRQLIPSWFLMPSLWIAGMGYFVDIYDLVLFGVLRQSSLQALGYEAADLYSAGSTLLNIQMAGMLLGGFLWGFYGDKAGRKKMLFGSILIYSLANLANAYVGNLYQYGICRFVAGIGLSGELGAAVTLVSEKLPRGVRGLGSIFIGALGFLGAVTASWLGDKMAWNHSYIVGGVLGLVLLVLRLGVSESEIFLKTRVKNSPSYFQLIKNLFCERRNLVPYVKLSLLGIPLWYTAGLLIYFSPEFAKELNVQEPIQAGKAILWSYLGSIMGDMGAGVVGQYLKSRKKTILLFQAISWIAIPSYFFLLRGVSSFHFYLFCVFLGVANGHATLFIGFIAENFSTSARATTTSSITNLVRASVIPMSFIFQFLKPDIGVLNSGLILGCGVLILAGASLWHLQDTFHVDLEEV